MIGIAAVFGAVSIFAADFWLKSDASAQVETRTVEVPAPKVEFKTIVVASQPLSFGTALDRAQLAQIPWPKDALPQGSFETIDALLAEGSRVVLSPIEPNEPVLLTKLSGPNGRASLSNLLTPGMRAVAIKTDEIAGVGGFITPGDRVDVVLTRDAGEIDETKKSASGASGSTIATEVVVENARVLSVGQGADQRQTGPQVASSVTIEVNPDGASKIALARNIGTLSLQLRPAGEGAAATSGLTTISAFGGSLTQSLSDAGGAVVEAVAKTPEEPQFRTVVVTRGVDGGQTYRVPEAPVKPNQSLANAAEDFDQPVEMAEKTAALPEAAADARPVPANPTGAQQGPETPDKTAAVPRAPADVPPAPAGPDPRQGLDLPQRTSAVPVIRGVETAASGTRRSISPRRNSSSSTDYFTSTPGLY
jgi:pilus assembly protein CpaB